MLIQVVVRCLQEVSVSIFLRARAILIQVVVYCSQIVGTSGEVDGIQLLIITCLAFSRSLSSDAVQITLCGMSN
jgi:hypothetical protein